jgi:hypothetical protein
MLGISPQHQPTNDSRHFIQFCTVSLLRSQVLQEFPLSSPVTTCWRLAKKYFKRESAKHHFSWKLSLKEKFIILRKTQVQVWARFTLYHVCSTFLMWALPRKGNMNKDILRPWNIIITANLTLLTLAMLHIFRFLATSSTRKPTLWSMLCLD